MDINIFGPCDQFESTTDMSRKWRRSIVGLVGDDNSITPLYIGEVGNNLLSGNIVNKKGDLEQKVLNYGFKYIPYPLDDLGEEFRGSFNIEKYPFAANINRVAARMSQRGLSSASTSLHYLGLDLLSNKSLDTAFTKYGYPPELSSKSVMASLFKKKEYPSFKEAVNKIFDRTAISVALSPKYAISLSQYHSGLVLYMYGNIVGEIVVGDAAHSKIPEKIHSEVSKLCQL